MQVVTASWCCSWLVVFLFFLQRTLTLCVLTGTNSYVRKWRGDEEEGKKCRGEEDVEWK